MKNFLKQTLGDGDIKEILSKGFSFLIIRLLGILAGYLFIYLVTKNYGASVYGLVALCFSIFIIAGIFGRFGIDINLVKFYGSDVNWEEKGLFYKVLIKSLLISSTLAVLLYLAQDLIVLRLFKKPQLEPHFIWALMAIPFWSATLLCAGLLRAKRKNNWYAFLNNPGRFAFSALALVVLWSLIDSPINAIKAHFIGVVILFLLGFSLCIYTLEKVTFKTTQSSWGFLRESFPMMLSSAMLVMLGWLDTIVLGIYETDSNIGIYNVALKIATLTSFSLQAINSILAPKLAKCYAEDNQPLFHKLIRITTKLNFLITIVLVLGILISRYWLLSFFGAEFVAGSTVLVLLCVGQLINSISGSVGVIFQMIGKQIIYQNIVLIALILNLILNFTLTPIYGMMGAAVATVVSIASWNIIGTVYLKRKMAIESYFNPFRKSRDD